ncbi:MAG: hypothetical protein HY727_14165 [Candidatus Rokubacteria bacterium]|nr:hypothetical protein [Candidatus Rokubacteria bacterium]
MKTAISIPEDLYAKAERFGRRVRKSRSRLYSEALAEYLARHAPDDVTATLDAVCADVNTEPDAFIRESARRTLERSEW